MFKCLPISGFKQLLDIFLVSVFEELEKFFKILKTFKSVK